MMFAIYDLIKKGRFSKGSTVIAVHTGGLQGMPPSFSPLQGEGITTKR